MPAAGRGGGPNRASLCLQGGLLLFSEERPRVRAWCGERRRACEHARVWGWVSGCPTRDRGPGSGCVRRALTGLPLWLEAVSGRQLECSSLDKASRKVREETSTVDFRGA